jgi:phage-related protein
MVTGDAKKLETAMGSASKSMSSFQSVALGTFAGGLITKGFDLAVSGAKALGKFVLDGVDKLDDMGDALALIETRAKGLSGVVAGMDLTTWGVDKAETAAAAASIAAMSDALALTDAQLHTVVPGMTELAAKLSSLGQGSPEQVADQLAKALSGSARAAKELGIELPKGAKGMDAYNAIMGQLGPKAAAATAGTKSLSDVSATWDAMLANLQLELAGYLDELAPVIAAMLEKLLPVLRELANKVGPAVRAIIGAISRAFTAFVSGGGVQASSSVLRTLAGVARQLADFFGNKVLPTLARVASALGTALAPVVKAAAAAFRDWLPVLNTVWGFLERYIVPILINKLIPMLGRVLTVVAQVAGAIGRTLGAALSTAANLFGRLLNAIQPILNALSRLWDLAKKVGSSLSGALGGILGRSSGSGRSGRSLVGSRAGVVNVYVNGGDPQAVVAAIRSYGSTSGGTDGFARAIAR